jgi:hypothetical protein
MWVGCGMAWGKGGGAGRGGRRVAGRGRGGVGGVG